MNEYEQSRQALLTLAKFKSENAEQAIQLRVVNAYNVQVELPNHAFDLLLEILQLMMYGKTVIITSMEEGEAERQLKAVRHLLGKLVDENQYPSEEMNKVVDDWKQERAVKARQEYLDKLDEDLGEQRKSSFPPR